jgi:hypothetical protein
MCKTCVNALSALSKLNWRVESTTMALAVTHQITLDRVLDQGKLLEIEVGET